MNQFVLLILISVSVLTNYLYKATINFTVYCQNVLIFFSGHIDEKEWEKFYIRKCSPNIVDYCAWQLRRLHWQTCSYEMLLNLPSLLDELCVPASMQLWKAIHTASSLQRKRAGDKTSSRWLTGDSVSCVHLSWWTSRTPNCEALISIVQPANCCKKPTLMTSTLWDQRWPKLPMKLHCIEGG